MIMLQDAMEDTELEEADEDEEVGAADKAEVSCADKGQGMLLSLCNQVYTKTRALCQELC